MKVMVAPQAFKGTLTVFEVGEAMMRGVQKALPGCECVFVPIADGGDGFMDVLFYYRQGTLIQQQVTGPLGERILVEWGIDEASQTAVIELSKFSGLSLIPEHRRNPLAATTFGIGEAILLALDKGIRHFLIGIGGSGTNDCGAGVIEALGGRFLDEWGNPLPRGGAALKELKTIDLKGLDDRLLESTFIVGYDVKNPMTGPEGASLVYSSQKGADPVEAERLEQAVLRFVEVIQSQLGIELNAIEGSGAAGGAGGGLHALLGARLISGIDLVLDRAGFDRLLKDADLVVTGEGRIDRQTTYGKGPIVVAHRAKARGIPVYAFVGSVGEGYEAVYDHGITKVIPL
ncbi:glycerate kinase [Waddlia chondrophila 2032/99]|uniref:Glycerate kinase n=2 Tax=Waddlia chondrophila TaxID=71667 RepID=D6YUU5_WADCW|nr:glycerate kinase [Waddlia chondrophila]ADI37906.1 Glycerate kinase [Waddlia chondrophila WSU 86-1044]CCB91280.1 glycerate kinase [Waddlia chondrophila 2032/99]